MTIKTLTYAALAERLKCGLETARSLVTGEVATLKARIESLQAELVKLEATAARHRADYERERDRADRLVSELLKNRQHDQRDGGQAGGQNCGAAPRCRQPRSPEQV